MDFVKSQSMKISVLPEQEKELSSKERIVSACKQPDVLAFDILCNESLIGFVMVRQYENNEFFLWNYAIDYRYQNQNLGTTALVEFISYMQKEYNMKVMTTTYIWGNEHAKHIYEKIGFVETDIVDEPDCHEVNMIYDLSRCPDDLFIKQANNLLKDQGFEYAFCGGYAIDLFLGYKCRTHGDIDILAYWKDRNRIIEYMWNQGFDVYEMLGEGKVHHITDINIQFIKKRNIFCIKEDCDFVRLTATTEKDIYIVEIIPAIQSKLNFIEFLFNDRTDEQFLYARNHNIKRALNKSILYADNIPYLAPELCLLYKSTDTERKGFQQDYNLSIQKMNNEQREWLSESLSALYPDGHKWN